MFNPLDIELFRRPFDPDHGAGSPLRHRAIHPLPDKTGDSAVPVSAPNLAYMLEMMERLGIDPAGGVTAHSSLTYMTALHRCHGCPSKEACRNWLDSAPTPASFAPRFCLNGDLLFELQYDQPGHIRGSFSDVCAAEREARRSRAGI